LDFRSLEHNFEVNAFIYDADFARARREEFLMDARSCRRISLHAWLRRPLPRRFAEQVMRLFSPLL
jgi:cardiolipin synthase